MEVQPPRFRGGPTLHFLPIKFLAWNWRD